MSFPIKVWIFSNNAQVVHTKSRIDTSWEKALLDHQAFNKEFSIYSENAEVASQLLPPTILDAILEAKSEVVEDKMCMELSFQRNLVFISISSVKDLFEPSIHKPVTAKEDFVANIKYLVSTTSLLRKLTLVN